MEKKSLQNKLKKFEDKFKELDDLFSFIKKDKADLEVIFKDNGEQEDAVGNTQQTIQTIQKLLMRTRKEI